MRKIAQSYGRNKAVGGPAIEYFISIPAHYTVPVANHCLIRVEGDSGKRFGIHAGDMVLADLDRHSSEEGIAVIWGNAERTAFAFKKATPEDHAVAVVHRLIPKREADELLYGTLASEVLV